MNINAFSLEVLDLLSSSNIVIGNTKLEEYTELLDLVDQIVDLHELYNGDSFRFS